MSDNSEKVKDLRMDAYYYGFSKTGAPAIDLILSAVACAGKAFHHTDQWTEEAQTWPYHTGETPCDWIQNAAIAAKTEIDALQARIAELEASRGVVVLPERKSLPPITGSPIGDSIAIYTHPVYNKALDDVAALNDTTITAAELEGLRKDGIRSQYFMLNYTLLLECSGKYRFADHVESGWHDTIIGAIDAAMAGQDAPCSKCGQVATGKGGEYPCPACGVPTVHDDGQDAAGGA